MNEEQIKNVQDHIVQAMIDLCENSSDVYCIDEFETVFERLAHIHAIAGGDIEVLEGIWPEYFL